MNPLGIYIHWPFCQSKCPYCDFNSHVRDKIDQALWQEHFLKELTHYKNSAEPYHVRSIFFGGGTPSLMSPKIVEALVESVCTNFKIAENLEITLEANPTSIEIQNFKDFNKAGINRVSIGIQSLNDDELRFLGRKHSAAEARRALEIADSTFDNVSFDLIYARPGQTLEKWEKELREGLEFGNPHLSLYQLTIEPNTVFEKQYNRGDFKLPLDDTSADLYDLTADVIAEFGLHKYEISNYARPGYESKHNLLYWEYEDYLGIGPGAHGRLKALESKKAIRNFRTPERWLTQVKNKGHGIQEEIILQKSEIIDECLLMGLRLSKGFPESRLQNLANVNFDDLLNQQNLRWLQDNDFVSLIGRNLVIQPKGQICLNTIIQKLLS